MSPTRTFDACLASATAMLADMGPDDEPTDVYVIGDPSTEDETLDLRTLVGKTVQTIDRYSFGWRMRFTDGTMICVNEGATFDRVGNFVREPV